MAVAALTAGGRKAGNKTPLELLQRFSFEPVMLMICGVNRSPEMTCWNFFVVLMRSMRTVRNFLRTAGSLQHQAKAGAPSRGRVGNVDSCIFILPQDTPLEFSHQFYNLF